MKTYTLEEIEEFVENEKNFDDGSCSEHTFVVDEKTETIYSCDVWHVPEDGRCKGYTCAIKEKISDGVKLINFACDTEDENWYAILVVENPLTLEHHVVAMPLSETLSGEYNHICLAPSVVNLMDYGARIEDVDGLLDYVRYSWNNQMMPMIKLDSGLEDYAEGVENDKKNY